MDPSSSSSSPAIELNSGVGGTSTTRGRRRSRSGSPPPPPSAAAEEGDGDVWDAVYGSDPMPDTPEREWDPCYFGRARISVLALMKMTMDAISGGFDQTVGIVLGRAVGDAIVVMDSFHLPGNAIVTEDESSDKYIDAYIGSAQQAGRSDVAIGWYHSHPGNGCWLSADAVFSQDFIQIETKQSLAIVIDSIRTVYTGKVEIGAFRTYVDGYKPLYPPVFECKIVPRDRIEEYRFLQKYYYALDITYFMSSLDYHLLNLLRNKYWVNSFSSPSLLANWDYAGQQVSNLVEELEEAEDQMDHTFLESSQPEKEQEESQLAKIARDSTRIAAEHFHRLIFQVRKNELFNSLCQLNETLLSLAN